METGGAGWRTPPCDVDPGTPQTLSRTSCPFTSYRPQDHLWTWKQVTSEILNPQGSLHCTALPTPAPSWAYSPGPHPHHQPQPWFASPALATFLELSTPYPPVPQFPTTATDTPASLPFGPSSLRPPPTSLLCTLGLHKEESTLLSLRPFSPSPLQPQNSRVYFTPHPDLLSQKSQATSWTHPMAHLVASTLTSPRQVLLWRVLPPVDSGSSLGVSQTS